MCTNSSWIDRANAPDTVGVRNDNDHSDRLLLTSSIRSNWVMHQPKNEIRCEVKEGGVDAMKWRRIAALASCGDSTKQNA